MRPLITLTAFIITLSYSFGQTAQAPLQIKLLKDNFYIYTTYNLYKGTPVPANGMYVVTNKGVALFDTPWDTTQFQPLLDSITSRHHQKVVMCISTHSHEDRTAGLEYYKQQRINTYTTKQTDEICKKKGAKRAEFLMTGDTVFTVGQYTFQTCYAGQGHTPDNIVVWFDKEKILYGGCLIKSIEATDLGNLADANVKAWATTIRNIQHKFGKPEFIIPGHNSWKSKKSLKHTLKLVRQYERTHRQ